tara:strand:- start:1139 stop:1315 length:177 start_codon:yes stop_codon:yes gene_type:complete
MFATVMDKKAFGSTPWIRPTCWLLLGLGPFTASLIIMLKFIVLESRNQWPIIPVAKVF